MATPIAAAWARNSVSATESFLGEPEAEALREDEASAVSKVSRVIISHRIRIAAKTSPIPSAVIWRARIQ